LFKQLAVCLNVKGVFTRASDMLEATLPDVVHITTPPQSHAALGRLCLESGSHVYMEKPFTLYASEAEELFALAAQKGLKIIAGHNAQFTPAMIRMRQWVKEGYLGGKPVHLECQYCYDFSDAGYARALLGDGDHWVRQLPGSLLQNIISHGISKIAEFMAGDRVTVVARGFTSRFLESIGEPEIVDEVRVILQDEESTTAYFTFSSQIGPAPHQFRVYGPKNSLIVDDDHQVVLKLDHKEYKSYLKYFIPPLGFARQYKKNWRHNLVRFLKRDFFLPNDAALGTIIAKFYDAVAGRAPLPLSTREILLTARIMDEIFAQIKSQRKNP